MKRLTCPFFLICLLLTCGLKCNTDVARVMLPELTETAIDAPPEDAAAPLFEMEAILTTTGQVRSPIPDDVYESLWGNWTKVGLSTPRRYYTKYIDADGIAIVGGDLVHDSFFQMARHIVLVMTAKLPGLRDALSYNQPGGITGQDIPFRLVLTEHFSKDFQNMPEYQNVNVDGIIAFLGTFAGYFARADVGVPPDDWGRPAGQMFGTGVIIHEMAHAIDEAILYHNLVPQFAERLEAAWAREKDKIRLRTEVDGQPYLPYIDANGEIVRKADLPAWEDRPLYCMAKSNSHDNASEFWAWFVEYAWFDTAFNPRPYEPNYNPIEDTWRPECPNLVSITEEVFPAFPLHWAINAKIEANDYNNH